MRNMFKYFVPPFIWALVIFLFSSFPTGSATEIVWTDFAIKKTAHIVEYGILTLLLYRAFTKGSGVDKKRAAIYSIFFAIFYGVSDEFHQSFTPGRMPKIRDVGFDTIGSVFSIYFIWNILPKMPKKLRRLAEDWEIA